MNDLQDGDDLPQPRVQVTWRPVDPSGQRCHEQRRAARKLAGGIDCHQPRHRQWAVLKNAQGVGLPSRHIGLLREPVLPYVPAQHQPKALAASVLEVHHVHCGRHSAGPGARSHQANLPERLCHPRQGTGGRPTPQQPMIGRFHGKPMGQWAVGSGHALTVGRRLMPFLPRGLRDGVRVLRSVIPSPARPSPAVGRRAAG
jgi:hypothetical protein